MSNKTTKKTMNDTNESEMSASARQQRFARRVAIILVALLVLSIAAPIFGQMFV